ncbi:MAG TPA: archaemetzincin, partial [Planctomycetaceae bacterium]|nr:archaemetzincin [Planctomycetaceae bacterium]
LGITLTDLYPEPDWNYVFGQASLRKRVGVYSFARFDPAFFDDPRPYDVDKLILLRCCRTLAHETCHMFGITHCTYFTCVVNGSNNLAESDSRPLHACPVCLRKLHESIGFDPLERDDRLLEVYRRLGLDDEAAWLERRLNHVRQIQDERGASAP